MTAPAMKTPRPYSHRTSAAAPATFHIHLLHSKCDCVVQGIHHILLHSTYLSLRHPKAPSRGCSPARAEQELSLGRGQMEVVVVVMVAVVFTGARQASLPEDGSCATRGPTVSPFLKGMPEQCWARLHQVLGNLLLPRR